MQHLNDGILCMCVQHQYGEILCIYVPHKNEGILYMCVQHQYGEILCIYVPHKIEGLPYMCLQHQYSEYIVYTYTRLVAYIASLYNTRMMAYFAFVYNTRMMTYFTCAYNIIFVTYMYLPIRCQYHYSRTHMKYNIGIYWIRQSNLLYKMHLFCQYSLVQYQ